MREIRADGPNVIKVENPGRKTATLYNKNKLRWPASSYSHPYPYPEEIEVEVPFHLEKSGAFQMHIFWDPGLEESRRL